MNDRTPDFTGTGQPGATVTVRKGAQVLCTAVVASSGSWSCTSTVELPFGSQGVTARQAALGRDSVDSALRTFDVAIRVIGVVAKDANRSGTATSGERNLVGIDVQLWSNGVDGLPQTGDDVLVATVTTTASGFEFPSVLPGKYTLRLVPATIAQGLYPTNDTDGGSNRIVALDLSSYGLAASPASPASTGPVIVSAYFGEMYAGINVLVTDSNGTPIRNAAVVFTDSAGHVFQGVTDGSGRLVIDGNESQWMALGAGSLTVRTADGRQVVQTVSVGAGTPVQAVATIPGDALIGDLPETGSHVAELVWVGGLAVAAGALLLLGRQQLGRQQFGRRRLGRRG